MNRFRLNQVLEVLLFPVSDPGLGKVDSDVLLECYETYDQFMEINSVSVFNITERMEKNGKYQKQKQKLVDYLVKRNNSRVKSRDQIELFCDLYYPMEEIDRYIKSFRKRNPCGAVRNVEIVSGYYMRKLARIAKYFITYRDGTVSVRSWANNYSDMDGESTFWNSSVYNKIEVWNLLCRITVPDIFVAAAAVEDHLGMEALYDQKAQIALADKLLLKSLQKGVAENHLHFNVGFDYETNWLYYMNLSFVEKISLGDWNQNKDLYKRLETAVFRYMAASYLVQGDYNDDFRGWLHKNYRDKGIVSIIQKLHDGEYNGMADDVCKEKIYKMYNSAYPSKRRWNEACAADYLLAGIYSEYIDYHISSEFLLLYQCCRHMKENEEDTFFTRTFLQYIRLKNSIFHEMQEQNVLPGLKYFENKYNIGRQAMGNDILPQEDMMVEVLRSQAKMKFLKKLEVRVAPYADEPCRDCFDYSKNRQFMLSKLGEQVLHIFYTYRNFIIEQAIGTQAAGNLLRRLKERGISDSDVQSIVTEKLGGGQVNIPVLGIVFHFLKTQTLEDRSGDYCWKSDMENDNRLSFSRMHKRYHLKNVAIALEELRDTIPYLSEYIVGIDAASDENAMEPWMFAPVYREMRTQCYTKPVIKTEDSTEKFHRIQNIGFTYHVGEDFRHIISGLRHIDEVLDEFGYKSGDRLGHALALGIDVGRWTMDNEMVPLPVLEHMENLLWMWGVCIKINLELSIRPEDLEDEILDIAQKLYDNSETITVKMLYRAYKKKFDSNHKEIAQRAVGSGKLSSGFYCMGDEKERCYSGWTVDKLLLTNYCPVYTERYKRIIPVYGLSGRTEVYRQLQEYLINKVERLGIYVETNPTSNLAIGDFYQMNEHPIFRLNQKLSGGSHHILVTVNSDDPAIFNTNVESELAYIYYAAEDQGYAKSDILEWIDQIRQYGMEASFVRREKSAEQIFSEVNYMLHAVERMLDQV